MEIRKASVDDAYDIWKLHERSVLGLCGDDYTPEQLQGWVEHSTLEKYEQRLAKHRSYVAELDGNMIGYVRWNPETNELCSIFVDPDHARQGVATKLMEIAYEDAKSHGVKEMWLDASLTAVPFYEVLGWTWVEGKRHGPLECIRMTFRLSPG